MTKRYVQKDRRVDDWLVATDEACDEALYRTCYKLRGGPAMATDRPSSVADAFAYLRTNVCGSRVAGVMSPLSMERVSVSIDCEGRGRVGARGE